MNLPLSAQIESLLFVRTQPTSTKWLADKLGVKTSAIAGALDELEAVLSGDQAGRGIVLVRHNDTAMLATHPEMAQVVEDLQKREIKSDLSKAALETLAIIAYKGELTKNEIDYIRGVNSQFMLRNLLIRGLIEKRENPNDKRRSLYSLSADSLTFLGITSLSELPDYEALTQTLSEIEGEYHNYLEHEAAGDSDN